MKRSQKNPQVKEFTAIITWTVQKWALKAGGGSQEFTVAGQFSRGRLFILGWWMTGRQIETRVPTVLKLIFQQRYFSFCATSLFGKAQLLPLCVTRTLLHYLFLMCKNNQCKYKIILHYFLWSEEVLCVGPHLWSFSKSEMTASASIALTDCLIVFTLTAVKGRFCFTHVKHSLRQLLMETQSDHSVRVLEG